MNKLASWSPVKLRLLQFWFRMIHLMNWSNKTGMNQKLKYHNISSVTNVTGQPQNGEK